MHLQLWVLIVKVNFILLILLCYIIQSILIRLYSKGNLTKNEDMEKYLKKREELRKKGERPDNALIIANPTHYQSFEKILNIPTLKGGWFIANGFEGLGIENGTYFAQTPFIENVKINIKSCYFQKLNPTTMY